MKNIRDNHVDKSGKFPILGGRLLKNRGVAIFNTQAIVSNPWREAIEVQTFINGTSIKIVSNPWREAIEGGKLCSYEPYSLVSNPWREAIEETKGFL